MGKGKEKERKGIANFDDIVALLLVFFERGVFLESFL